MVEHLERQKIIKQGSFYTPKEIVNLVYQLIEKNKITFDYICDTSAGYGDFILPSNKDKFIYVDIDQQALNICQQKQGPIFRYLCKNSLQNLTREDLGINQKSKLLIIGNPPYNDRTSFYKKNQKGQIEMSSEVWDRDLGISFLKSFVQLEPEYICVLHPLSYLTKQTKFRSLKDFKSNYCLLDGLVISSKYFDFTSKNIHFPVLIAVYQRCQQGMDFATIKTFPFLIYERKHTFSVDQFHYIEDFHTKYKDKNVVGPYEHFYTLRDMNQLIINKHWLDSETNNSIRVKTTDKKFFILLSKIGNWFQRHQNEYYFLGNLSPIIFSDWANSKELTTLTDQQITARFEKHLCDFQPPWQFNNNKQHLIWQFNNVASGAKYRFKLRDKLTDYGSALSSATYPVGTNAYLEAQIAYDKAEKDFEEKASLQKVAFVNNKDEQRFFFELSDMLLWTVQNGWINYKKLTTLIKESKRHNFLEDVFPIAINPPQVKKLFTTLDFIQSDITKPRLICQCVEGNFIEIQIDKRQKAVGNQAMLYYNINAKNLRKNGHSVVGQTVKKADLLEYMIAKKVAPQILIKLVVIFLNLSNRHHYDMKAIIEQIIASISK